MEGLDSNEKVVGAEEGSHHVLGHWGAGHGQEALHLRLCALVHSHRRRRRHQCQMVHVWMWLGLRFGRVIWRGGEAHGAGGEKLVQYLVALEVIGGLGIAQDLLEQIDVVLEHGELLLKPLNPIGRKGQHQLLFVSASFLLLWLCAGGSVYP